MVVELLAIGFFSFVSGLLVGRALGQYSYFKGYHSGYKEAVDFIDSRLVLVKEEEE